ncbi:MAG: hypothetical protein ACK4P3_02255 [Fimbriimonadaceae bacterium]
MSPVLALLLMQPAPPPLPPSVVAVYTGIPYLQEPVPRDVRFTSHSVTITFNQKESVMESVTQIRNPGSGTVNTTLAVPAFVQADDNYVLTWATTIATWSGQQLPLMYPGLPDIPPQRQISRNVNFYSTTATARVTLPPRSTTVLRINSTAPLPQASGDPLQYILYHTGSAVRIPGGIGQFNWSVRFRPNQVFAVDSHSPETTAFQIGPRGAFFQAKDFRGTVRDMKIAFYPEPENN